MLSEFISVEDSKIYIKELKIYNYSIIVMTI